MHIVFDMDNTLTDELGASARPGIAELLARLRREGHKLSVWTSSPKARAYRILKEYGLREYFSEIVAREDYDPDNAGEKKDIRTIQGDFLIDDDPKQTGYMREIGKGAFLITAFRKGSAADSAELDALHKAVRDCCGVKGLLKRIGL